MEEGDQFLIDLVNGTNSQQKWVQVSKCRQVQVLKLPHPTFGTAGIWGAVFWPILKINLDLRVET